MNAKEFYGESIYNARTDMGKKHLDKAVERLDKALISEAGGMDPNSKLIVGMVTLAAKSETEGFAA